MEMVETFLSRNDFAENGTERPGKKCLDEQNVLSILLHQLHKKNAVLCVVTLSKEHLFNANSVILILTVYSAFSLYQKLRKRLKRDVLMIGLCPVLLTFDKIV